MTYSFIKNVLVYLAITASAISCSFPDVNKKLKEVSRDGEIRDSLFVDSISRHWVYMVQEDEMSPEKIYSASRAASKTFKLNSSEKYLAKITLGYRDGANEVYLLLEGCKFKIYGNNKTEIKIRVDSAEPRYFNIYSKTGKNNEIVSIDSADTFISLIKNARRLRILAELESYGEKIFEFKVGDLKWDHVTKMRPKKNGQSNTAKLNSGSGSSTGSWNMFDDILNDARKPAARTSVHVSTGSVSDKRGGDNKFSLISTKENIDKANDMVTLACKCRNNNSEESVVTLKAYFMDGAGNTLSTKEMSLSCSGNMDITTDISASGITNNYKTFKVEVE